MTFTLGLEAAWGADLDADPSTWTWTDLTGDWYRNPLNIRRGRPDEAGQHQPSSASFTLLNDSGDYTPDFATGAYYPNVVRDTPVRAYVEVAGAWLADGTASTPDHASLDITGDIFVAVDFDASTVNNEVLARKSGSAGQRSWLLFRQDTSDFVFRHSTDGTALSTFELRLPYRRGCIGVHLDVDNGASGHTVTWFWKNEWADSWEEIYTETASGTTSVFSSTADVEVGDSDAPRRVRHFELRSGDEGGTAVANPDFTAQAAGATSFADAAGRTWTVDAGEITNREVRFWGNAAEFQPYWPVGGIDEADPHARCDVTAGGVLRRLRQGKSVLGPALNRTIPTVDTLVAYWPMDDGSESTRAASPLDGVPAARYVDPAAEFTPGASDDTPPGSAPLLVFPGPMASTGVVGNIPPSAVGTFSCMVLYYADAAPASEGRFLDVHTSTGYRWRVSFTTTSATVYLHRGDTLVDSTAAGFTSDVFGGWRWLQLTAEQNGSDVDWSLTWYDRDSAGSSISDTYTSVSIGYPRSFTLSGDDGWAAGHLAVFESTIDASFFPVDAYKGDLTAERVVRLADESGIAADVFWPIEHGSPMGPQPDASRPDAMEDCATAETGILSERIDGPGLVFQTRDVRYNRPVVEFSASDLGPAFRPTSDDQRYRNDITADRPDGSSYRAVDPDATATYEDSVSLNVETDDDLPDAASWLLHLGTWPGMRYPTVVLPLYGEHATDAFIAKAVALIPGDVIRITDLPTQHPAGDVDLIVEGWSESITRFTWTITLTCTPAGPWTVGVLEDDVLGRADTAGSELDAAIDDNDTAIDVATTLGPVWIDDGAFPTEFPFDIVIGGEVMTVTANSDTASPQTFTVTRSVNGVVKSHADGSAVRLAHPLVLAR